LNQNSDYLNEARNGYRYLAVGKLAKNQNCLETFDYMYGGINLLQSAQNLILIVDFVNMAVWLMEFYTLKKI
jgi:hypothetical protein